MRCGPTVPRARIGGKTYSGSPEIGRCHLRPLRPSPRPPERRRTPAPQAIAATPRNGGPPVRQTSRARSGCVSPGGRPAGRAMRAGTCGTTASRSWDLTTRSAQADHASVGCDPNRRAIVGPCDAVHAAPRPPRLRTRSSPERARSGPFVERHLPGARGSRDHAERRGRVLARHRLDDRTSHRAGHRRCLHDRLAVPPGYRPGRQDAPAQRPASEHGRRPDAAVAPPATVHAGCPDRGSATSRAGAAKRRQRHIVT